MSRPGIALAVAGALVSFELFAGAVTAQEMGTVLSEQQIASGTGGFGGQLDNNDHFGHALACLGDLDGDEVGELAVGTPDDDDGGASKGAVWILFSRRDGTVRTQAKISSTQGGFQGRLDTADRFGSAVAALGDLDGDGTLEVAVGAEQDDDGGLDSGALWILSLSADGRVVLAHKIGETSGGFAGVLRDGDRFGCALASLGDLDGDGIAELAVGANEDRDGGLGRGALWVLFLDAQGSVRRHAKISSTSGGFTGVLHDGDRFGFALASLGDIDRDGTTELAVGADQDDDGGPNSGATWILSLRQDASVRTQAKLSWLSGLDIRDNDHFGASLAPLGDVDGDRTNDLAVGATLDDDGGLNRGAVWVLFLERDGSVKGSQRICSSQGGLVGPLTANCFFGTALAALGDLDGDHKLDLAVSAEGDSTGGVKRGTAWVLFLETAMPPTLVVRNGLGVNPILLTAEAAPVIASIWQVRIDCRGFRDGIFIHLVVDTPVEGRLRGGLGQPLIDWSRPRILCTVARHHGTQMSVFHAVPDDTALVGLPFYSQALVTGRGGAKLTNALDGELEGSSNAGLGRTSVSHPLLWR